MSYVPESPLLALTVLCGFIFSGAKLQDRQTAKSQGPSSSLIRSLGPNFKLQLVSMWFLAFPATIDVLSTTTDLLGFPNITFGKSALFYAEKRIKLNLKALYYYFKCL